jgi:predicted transcriptional regulator of viral defense system
MVKATADLSTREFLERNAVFTTAEFRAALPSETPSSTVLNRLQQAYRRGYVDRVGHGVYASRVGTFLDHAPEPLLVASKLAPEYVVAYHSALEAHGVAHAPFRRVTFLSARTSFKVTYRDYEFLALRPPRSLVVDDAWKTSVVQLRRGDQLITASSRERTLVDCLDNLKWGGGVEEVLRSIGGFPSLNVEHVITYLDLLRSASATAKVGWVLSADPELWKVTSVELETLRSRLGKGPYFLSQRRQDKTFVSEWRLYVPAGLDAREALRG